MNCVARFTRVVALAATLSAVALAAGCQQKSPQAVLASVQQDLSEGKFKEVLAQGQDFLAGKEDSSGQLAWALSRACAQLGKPDLALDYAAQAVKAGAVSGVDLMSEPLLDPVRTDIRLVALAAGAAPALPVPRQPRDAGVSANGAEATAGDVSVKLPD